MKALIAHRFAHEFWLIDPIFRYRRSWWPICKPPAGDEDQTAGGPATGSLAFSLLIDPQQFGLPRQAMPRLSLAVGVAVIDAVAPRLAEHPLGLHWPNDVFVGAASWRAFSSKCCPTAGTSSASD